MKTSVAADDMQLFFFCFDHEIYDDTPLFNYQQCQFHYFYEFS